MKSQCEKPPSLLSESDPDTLEKKMMAFAAQKDFSQCQLLTHGRGDDGFGGITR